MRRWLGMGLLGLITATLVATMMDSPNAVGGEQPVAMKIAAPELQGIDNWINSKPLQLKDLRGQVVVVHFWTFG